MDQPRCSEDLRQTRQRDRTGQCNVINRPADRKNLCNQLLLHSLFESVHVASAVSVQQRRNSLRRNSTLDHPLFTPTHTSAVRISCSLLANPSTASQRSPYLLSGLSEGRRWLALVACTSSGVLLPDCSFTRICNGSTQSAHATHPSKTPTRLNSHRHLHALTRAHAVLSDNTVAVCAPSYAARGSQPRAFAICQGLGRSACTPRVVHTAASPTDTATYLG